MQKVEGYLGVGVGAIGACGKGAVASQHGTGVREVCILALRTTIPSKGFFGF